MANRRSSPKVNTRKLVKLKVPQMEKGKLEAVKSKKKNKMLSCFDFRILLLALCNSYFGFCISGFNIWFDIADLSIHVF